MPNESFEDCYQVMKFCGEEIDRLHFVPLDTNQHAAYWDLNNLWWDAASIYVPSMHKLNSNVKMSH